MFGGERYPVKLPPVLSYGYASSRNERKENWFSRFRISRELVGILDHPPSTRKKCSALRKGRLQKSLHRRTDPVRFSFENSPIPSLSKTKVWVDICHRRRGGGSVPKLKLVFRSSRLTILATTCARRATIWARHRQLLVCESV